MYKRKTKFRIRRLNDPESTYKEIVVDGHIMVFSGVITFCDKDGHAEFCFPGHEYTVEKISTIVTTGAGTKEYLHNTEVEVITENKS